MVLHVVLFLFLRNSRLMSADRCLPKAWLRTIPLRSLRFAASSQYGTTPENRMSTPYCLNNTLHNLLIWTKWAADGERKQPETWPRSRETPGIIEKKNIGQMLVEYWQHAMDALPKAHSWTELKQIRYTEEVDLKARIWIEIQTWKVGKGRKRDSAAIKSFLCQNSRQHEGENDHIQCPCISQGRGGGMNLKADHWMFYWGVEAETPAEFRVSEPAVVKSWERSSGEVCNEPPRHFLPLYYPQLYTASSKWPSL